MNRMDISEKAAPSRLELGLRLAFLPALILGVLSQKAHAAVDPAAAIDPAAAVDPAAALAPAAAADPAADPAAPVSFDQDFFLKGNAPKVDISRFEKGDVVMPGTYRGDIRVNETWRARGDIVMANVAGKDSAQPCFDAKSLVRYGIDIQKVAAHTDPTQVPSRPIPASGQFCGPIGDYIPGATASFDSGEQILSLSVPQIYVMRSARGYVDPSQWDAGINAAVVNYNANVYRSTGAGARQTSGYLGLNSSFNLGAWHLIHQGALNWTEHQGTKYQNTATYVQHDVPAWKAQVEAGDVFTGGDIFDSVRLRGVRMYSDDRMLPQSLRGYAPVIRGVASSNAKVAVKQRGYLIYETTVAPGPFVIDDLYPTGYGGDLDVEVTEADGRIQRFSVPYAAVPQLLRPGQDRWELDVGKVNQIGLLNTPFVGQATYRRGVTNNVTLYGGASFATAYHNILAGGALNTNVGAFSADITQGRNKVPGQKGTTGLSLRVAYSKNVTQTGTNFALAAYRYSTSGFVGLNDAVYMRDAVAHGRSADFVSRPRSRLDASVYQALGEGLGQVYFAGSSSNFWNRSGRQVSYSAGYSNSYRSLTYSFSAQRTRERFADQPLFGNGPVNRIPGSDEPIVRSFNTRSDTTLWFTVSVPLGVTQRAPMFSAQHTHSDLTGNGTQVGVSGAFDEGRRFTYNASMSHANNATTSGVFGQYNGSRSNLSAGFTHGGGANQVNASASGTVVAHSGGVTFSPPTGDTLGLVYAPGAEGAQVQGALGSTVDSHGYALVPYLQPYQLNDVDIDPKGSAASVEFDSTTQSVAPRAGSVVRLEYKTNVGRALLIDGSMEDGTPVPFGADVFDEAGNSVGVVGQAGRIFVHGLENGGDLTVRWGERSEDGCRIHVPTAPGDKPAGKDDYEKFAASCHAGINAIATEPGKAATPTASAESDVATPGDQSTGSVTSPGNRDQQ